MSWVSCIEKSGWDFRQRITLRRKFHSHQSLLCGAVHHNFLYRLGVGSLCIANVFVETTSIRTIMYRQCIAKWGIIQLGFGTCCAGKRILVKWYIVKVSFGQICIANTRRKIVRTLASSYRTVLYRSSIYRASFVVTCNIVKIGVENFGICSFVLKDPALGTSVAGNYMSKSYVLWCCVS